MLLYIFIVIKIPVQHTVLQRVQFKSFINKKKATFFFYLEGHKSHLIFLFRSMLFLKYDKRQSTWQRGHLYTRNVDADMKC